jgi:hypothetical protein
LALHYPKSLHQIKVDYFIVIQSNDVSFFVTDKSKSKGSSGKSASEYLAADMYDYTTFSYYDMETSMTSFRLPQPSPNAPSKPPEPAPQKK